MKILVTIPNLAWVHRQVLGLVVRMMAESKHELSIDAPVFDPPYDNALNHIAKAFREGSWDYWLNVDADNPPSRNPLELVELDKDIIGCPTPRIKVGQTPMVTWMAYNLVDGKHVTMDGKGLEKRDAVSSGAMLIAHRVFEHPDMQKHPFLSVYNVDGFRILGPDFAFCGRARNSGFEIYAHYDYPSYHYKEVELGELMGKV